MKALVLEEPGKIESLTVVHNREVPIPKENEIRVKVIAAGINPSDYQIASYPEQPTSEKKRVLGLDVAGIVDAIGTEVTNFKVGDRVYYLRSITNLDGGFAEYAVTTAHTASKLPDSINFEVAATVPGAGFTAYQTIVQKFRPQRGKTILIHGGAGGVGGYAIQLAKLCGLTVYTTCQGRDIEYVKSLGADEAIDFTKEDVNKVILELTNNKGIDYIFSTINSKRATEDLDILAFGGELAVTAGFPNFDRFHFYDKGMSLHEIALGEAHTKGDYYAQSNLAAMGNEFAKLLADNKIMPPAITVISMKDIPEYLIKLKEGKVTGKIVAKIE